MNALVRALRRVEIALFLGRVSDATIQPGSAPGPGADVAAAGQAPVVQMWQGSPVPVQMW